MRTPGPISVRAAHAAQAEPMNEAMKIDGYEIDVLLQGFPGRMVCHGGLGWSTVALTVSYTHLTLPTICSV